METFKLTVRTPNQNIYVGEAKAITLAAEGGEMQVFANHASLTATILFSPVVVNVDGKTNEEYVVRNGLFLFDNAKNEASLLALHCEHKAEVSTQTVKEYAQFIREQLEKGEELSEFQISYLEKEQLALEKHMEVAE